MKRHLKLRGVWLPTEKKVKVTVLEMTSFSDTWYTGLPENQVCDDAFIFRNVRVRPDYSREGYSSDFIDSWHIRKGLATTLYLPREEYYVKDWVAYMTLDEWKLTKEFVEYYNNFYEEGD